MKIEQVMSLIPEIYLTIGIVGLIAYGVSMRGETPGRIKEITQQSLLVIAGAILIVGGGEEVSIMKQLVLGAGLGVILISVEEKGIRPGSIEEWEFTIIVMISMIGMLLIIATKDLITMYLGVETISLSLYIMATLRKTGQYSTEAGLKYIVLGAISSGIILIGISLIYLKTGSIDSEELSKLLIMGTDSGTILGALFIMVAILFKLGVAPLHMWVPDVYEGAPTIVTLYFSVVPKIAIIGLLLTLITNPLIGLFETSIQPLLITTALISILVGSVGAINQTKIKRVLAYSAIAHIGWVIIGVSLGTITGLQAALIYLIIYVITGLLTFSIIITLFAAKPNIFIIQLSGLARWAAPLAAALSLGLLSIAGVPPLAGFYSKFVIILALVQEGWFITSIVAILISVIGAFYYLRIIQLMYFNDSLPYQSKNVAEVLISPSQEGSYPLPRVAITGVTFFLILSILIYPTPIIALSYKAILTFVL